MPDDTREGFRPSTDHGGSDEPGRSLRCVSWTYDDDPADTVAETAYAFLLREGTGQPHVVLDVHRIGLFARFRWLEALASVGFEARALPWRHSWRSRLTALAGQVRKRRAQAAWRRVRSRLGAIVALSDFGAREVSRAFGLPPEKLYRIYPGISPAIFRPDE